MENELNSLGENLSGFVTLTALAASFSCWLVILRRSQNARGILPQRFRHLSVHVPRGAVAISISWICFSFLAILFSEQQKVFEPIKALLQARATVVVGTGLLTAQLLAVLLGSQRTTDPIKLGLRCDHPAGQIRDGAFGFLLAILPVFLTVLATSPLRTEETVHPFLRVLADPESRSALPLIIFAAVVIAPLQEEMMFRVVLQSWLAEWLSPFMAITITAVLFGAVHRFPDSLAIVVLSLFLGFLYHRRRSYLAIVTLHALFNSYNVVALLLETMR